MSVYFNEFDTGAAQWLRQLMATGEIPHGEVDERSIRDVQPADVAGHGQQHYFAGVGGWAEALRLAGWGDRPVWTGSCPCQPFSSAGKRKGTADDRDMWPEFFRLIEACRPQVVFGEQVASADVVGTGDEAAFVDAVRRGQFARANKLAHRLARSRSTHFAPRWVDRVRADLEGIGYTFRAAILGAHSPGAPHIRQRLYWVANADGGRQQQCPERFGRQAQPGQCPPQRDDAGGRGRPRRLADADGRQPGDGGLQPGREHGQQPEDGGTGGGVGDAVREYKGIPSPGDAQEASGRGTTEPRPSGGKGFWDAYDLIPCRDGKLRRVPRGVEPGVLALADGLQAGVAAGGLEGRHLHPLAAGKLPGRVGLLRGAGNAICPQTAAAFVAAFLEAERGLT